MDFNIGIMAEKLCLISDTLAHGNAYVSCSILAVLAYVLVIVVGSFVNLLEICFLVLFGKALGTRFAYFAVVYLTFPGTVLHELSHALFGVLSGARITEISFFERPSSRRLGHVAFVARGNFVARALQFSLISCAPVVVGIVLLYVLFLLMGSISFPMVLFPCYIAFSIFCHMSMSRQDVLNYLRGVLIVLPLLWGIIFFTRLAAGS